MRPLDLGVARVAVAEADRVRDLERRLADATRQRDLAEARLGCVALARQNGQDVTAAVTAALDHWYRAPSPLTTDAVTWLRGRLDELGDDF